MLFRVYKVTKRSQDLPEPALLYDSESNTCEILASLSIVASTGCEEALESVRRAWWRTLLTNAVSIAYSG
jgi:hypothetical protein